ncbi:MAG: DUF1015 domain-containing protein [SAR202 cluster bacterium]|nr:DUF1015 domain-containing protein [SAR202 cluster bacterium]
MADFRPFRGWRYNPQAAGNLEDLICPPYDLIGPDMEESLRQRSPYNIVHVEGGEAPHPAGPQDDPYARAAATLHQWQRERVLVQDAHPQFYLVRHGFQFRGQAHQRLELFGRLRIEEYEKRVVLPHEFTRQAPVADRVALMAACQANVSPIMSLYRDRHGQVAKLLAQVMSSRPAVDIRGMGDQDYALWPIGDTAICSRISQAIAGEPIFLADGHHRYEAALQFQRRQAKAMPAASPEAGHNFVMMALIAFEDPGLMVLPYHRVLGGLSAGELAKVRQRLQQLFETRHVSLAGDSSGDKLVAEVAALGRTGQVLALVEAGSRDAQILSLRKDLDRTGWGLLSVSEAWILEEQVLKPALGTTAGSRLTYLHDHQAALQMTASGAQQMAFLLRPFPLDRFEEVVGQGQRLPPKSTFFYPKLATGLVINQLNGLV